MGTTEGYRREGCGYSFGAVGDFSCGFLGVVITPVVCPERGLVTAEVGANAVHGEWLPEVNPKRKFPFPQCAEMAPRWNRKSSPKCSGPDLFTTSILIWD